MKAKNHMMRIVLILLLVGCAQAADDLSWFGEVEADIDDLTGQRTGLFRTYGPTSLLVGGSDTIPVTIGYYCNVDGDETPLAVTDGLFFKVAMPDTSLTQRSDREIEELQGTLGLLDVARLSVDGNVVAWRYNAVPSIGAWHLDGDNGFSPPGSPGAVDSLESTMLEAYQSLQRSASNRLFESLERRLVGLTDSVRTTWPVAHDYVNTNYSGRNSLAVELARVVQFDMSGFDAAVDSIRFWCPAPQAHHEWNTRRREFFERAAAAHEPAIAARMAAVERGRRQAAEGARQAAEGRARSDSWRAAADARSAARAARRDSLAAVAIARSGSMRKAAARRDSAQTARNELDNELITQIGISSAHFAILKEFGARPEAGNITLDSVANAVEICRVVLTHLESRDRRVQRNAPMNLRESCTRIVGATR